MNLPTTQTLHGGEVHQRLPGTKCTEALRLLMVQISVRTVRIADYFSEQVVINSEARNTVYKECSVILINQIERGQDNNLVKAVCPQFSRNITQFSIFSSICIPNCSAQSFPRNYDFKLNKKWWIVFQKHFLCLINIYRKVTGCYLS